VVSHPARQLALRGSGVEDVKREPARDRAQFSFNPTHKLPLFAGSKQDRLGPGVAGPYLSAHADAESGFHPMGKTASL
jgi:hypothetical protein